MGLGTWLGDKSKRQQLRNLQTVLRAVFQQLIGVDGLLPSQRQAFLQVLQPPLQPTTERYVEAIAAEAGGMLKGPELWPAFAISMEAADEALSPELAEVAKRMMTLGYKRAAEKWTWPAEPPHGASMAAHWKGFARLFGGQDLTDAEAEEMAIRYARFDSARSEKL